MSGGTVSPTGYEGVWKLIPDTQLYNNNSHLQNKYYKVGIDWTSPPQLRLIISDNAINFSTSPLDSGLSEELKVN